MWRGLFPLQRTLSLKSVKWFFLFLYKCRKTKRCKLLGFLRSAHVCCAKRIVQAVIAFRF